MQLSLMYDHFITHSWTHQILGEHGEWDGVDREIDCGNVSQGGRGRFWKCIGRRKREMVEMYRREEERDCGNVSLGGRERLWKCISSSFPCSTCGFLISSESSSSSSSLAGPYPVSSSPFPAFPSSLSTCLKCWEQNDLPWTVTTKETGVESQLKTLVSYYLLNWTPEPLSSPSLFLSSSDT